MASTSIAFLSDEGRILPNLAWLPMVLGDSISFVPADGPAPVLFFSEDLIAVLDPAPSSPLVLDPSSTVEFTFTSDQPGVYAIHVAAASDALPDFSATPSPHVFFHAVEAEAANPEPVPAPPPEPVPMPPPPVIVGSSGPPVQSGNLVSSLSASGPPVQSGN